jgi:hypothetical protein
VHIREEGGGRLLFSTTQKFCLGVGKNGATPFLFKCLSHLFEIRVFEPQC